jgi:O-antigen ligase
MAALVAGMAVFFVHYSADLAPRLETIYSRSQDKTGSGRLAIWPAAVGAFNERPFIGIGYGAFVRTSVDRIYSTPGSSIENFNVHPEEVHNVFLGTAAELGIIGLTIFLGLLASTGLLLRRTAKRARDMGDHYLSSVANALIVGLVGWCVGSMFIETETSRPIWILIGLSLALPKLIPEREGPEPR